MTVNIHTQLPYFFFFHTGIRTPDLRQYGVKDPVSPVWCFISRKAPEDCCYWRRDF